MSFNTLPAELIKRILGHIPDLRHRCRLERVNKTFRSCLRDRAGLAWTLGESKLDLRLMTRHGPQLLDSIGRVTALEIPPEFIIDLYMRQDTPFYVAAISAIYANVEIFELDQLTVNRRISSDLWIWLLSTFRNTLQQLRIGTDGEFSRSFHQRQLRTIFGLLKKCSELRDLQIDFASAIDYSSLSQVLEGKSLERLSLRDCYLIKDVQLADIINAFPQPGSLRELCIYRRKHDPNRFQSFSLDQFCERLDTAAGQKIQNLTLDGVLGAFLDTLPSLPKVFPALTKCILKVYQSDLNAAELTQSLTDFLKAGQDRQRPIDLQLCVFTRDNSNLVDNIWQMLHLGLHCAFGKGMRIKRMPQQTRKVNHGRVSLTFTLQDELIHEPFVDGDGREEDMDEDEDEVDSEDEDSEEDEDEDDGFEEENEDENLEEGNENNEEDEENVGCP